MDGQKEPGANRAIAIYSVKFCPWAPNDSPLFAFVAHNRIHVYSIDQSSNRAQHILRLSDPKESECYYTLDWSYRKQELGVDLILAIGGSEMKIQILNVSEGAYERTLIGHMNDIHDLKFHPSAKCILLSASKDCSIRLWNVDKGFQLGIYAGVDGHFGGVNCVDWHDSGELFASGGIDYCVKIWKVTPQVRKRMHESSLWTSKTKKFPLHICLAAFSTNKLHNSYVDCVKFYGNLLLSKSVYDGIYLWLPNMRHSPVNGWSDSRIRCRNCGHSCMIWKNMMCGTSTFN